MKEDLLEKFILENKDEFDDQLPSPNLWDAIEKKKSKPRIATLINTKLAIAASILIIATSGIAFLYINNNDNTYANTNHNNNNEASNDLNEARAYYTSQIQQRSSELFNYAKNYPEITAEIYQEFEKLDSSYNNLQKDLNENIANEVVIQAMIEHYRIKLKMMEDILNQLKGSNNNKSLPQKNSSYDI